jgi:hypothetical protein
MVASGGGLIRALGTPGCSDPKQAGKTLLSARATAMWRSNISLNPTGMSLSFIVNLDDYAVDSRRVNSGVGLLAVLQIAIKRCNLVEGYQEIPTANYCL